MNILSESFNTIDTLVQELYPGTCYNVIIGTALERIKDTPTAAMAMSKDPDRPSVIEMHPDMTLAHIVKSLLRLLSHIISNNMVGDTSMTDSIESDLFERYSLAVSNAYNNMIIEGEPQLVIN